MKIAIDSIVIGERARKEVGCLDPLERSLEFLDGRRRRFRHESESDAAD